MPCNDAEDFYSLYYEIYHSFIFTEILQIYISHFIFSLRFLYWYIEFALQNAKLRVMKPKTIVKWDSGSPYEISLFLI